MKQRFFKEILPQLVVTVLYVVGLWFAHMFIKLPGEVTPVWPPAGIAFAATLLYGYRALFGVALGVILGQALFSPVSLVFLPFTVAANVGGPAFATFLLRRYGPVDPLSVRVRNTFGLLFGGCCLGIVSALIGEAGMLVADYSTWENVGVDLLLWWVGDFFGVMVCTPALICTVISIKRYREGNRRVLHAPLFEVVIWFTMFVALALFAYKMGQVTRHASALLNLPLALFLWSAFRFPPIYTYLSVAATLLISLVLAGLGLPGFPQPVTPVDTGVLMLFLCILAVLPQLVTAANFERRYFESKLVYRANHDRLTGLRNRNAFEEHASAVMVDSVRTGEKLGMGYLDLDQFKVVNDTCGHTVGDNLIRQITAVLEDNLQPGDIIARIGGDEFAVLFRNCSDKELTARADVLRHQVEEFRFVWQEKLFAFTVSIGLVALRSNTSFTRQLSIADTACYQAKQLGRNRVKLVRPDDMDINRHHDEVEWVVRINEALAADRFRLYCQPIVPLVRADESYRHFEILLRMLDERGNVLLPGTFIPAAERFNLMSKLDRWVVTSVLKWLEKHPRCMASTSVCAINLSGPSLSDSGFQRFLKSAIDSHGVPAEKICFEITETAAIGDLTRANRFIKSMRRAGCRFALDDFGSGLASFGYLKTLHVDYLKIDGAFVRDIARAPIDLAMVKSINEVGHVMGKKTIAEFVESDEVIQELLKLGVDYAQGYAVGRPMPIEEYFRETSTIRSA